MHCIVLVYAFIAGNRPIYKCDTVHVIVAWGGVYREKLDIDSAKLILYF